MLNFSGYRVALIQEMFLIPRTFHLSSHLLSNNIATPVKITANIPEIVHS